MFKFKKQLRLPNYNYGSEGYYFVTICTKNREQIFGEIINGEINLSKIGETVDKNWKSIPEHFKFAQIDEYIVMPDHIHGIIRIPSNPCGYGPWTIPTGIPGLQPQPNSISIIIRNFKASVTLWARKNNLKTDIWQSRFHDHIIRNDRELFYIQKYIIENPKKWNPRTIA